MINRTLRYAGLSLVFTLILASLYLYSYRPYLYQWPHNIAITLPAVICEPKQSPEIMLPKGEMLSIQLSITPLPALSPVFLQLMTDEVRLEDISVMFSDLSSQHRFIDLIPHSEGAYVGKTVLPSIPVALDSIQLSLSFTYGQTFYRIPLIFKEKST